MTAVRNKKNNDYKGNFQERDARGFYRKLILMVEEEKRKISRDLHDETGQIVIALGASLNIIEKELKKGNIENAIKLIGENRKTIQEIASRMKSMAFTLRPPGLDILGLAAVLREYFSQSTKSSSIKIEFRENLADIKLGEDIEITLYRVIQEAIYNILKHSKAKTAEINLIVSGRELQLIIKDDGRGFDVEQYRRERDLTKVGLRGIKERMDILGGVFSIESGHGKGTVLEIKLPLG
jgi:two-component system sensor histidine kinase DegS